MVRRNAFRWILATLALIGAKSAGADPITFTGNVGQDFNPVTNPNVQMASIDANPLAHIVEPSFMTNAGLITGWAVKDLRLDYESSTDTLYVGVNTYTVSGSAVGTSDPSIVSQLQGSDPAHFGAVTSGTSTSDKSVALQFAANNPTDPNSQGSILAVAGIPGIKPPAGTAGYGLDNFTVASYNGSPTTQFSFGSPLLNNVGTLAFDPNAAHPNLEFTIKNFSKISPLLNPVNGFWVKLYSGSGQDGQIGEESPGWIHIPGFPEPQNIPEPTTWLAWTLIAGGVAVRLRRAKQI